MIYDLWLRIYLFYKISKIRKIDNYNFFIILKKVHNNDSANIQ